MAKQDISVGAAPDDGTGDPVRDAFIKINQNFTEVYGGSFTQTLALNRTDGGSEVLGQLNGVTQWSVVLGDATKAFEVRLHDASGNWVFSPLSCSSNGNTNMGSSLYLAFDPYDPLEAATKQYVDNRAPKITVGTTAPSSPAVNDVWIDTN